MGIALGCIGMRRDDFERCTPNEFKKTWDAWEKAETRRMRDGWERGRMLGLCMLQPWAKKKLEAHDIMTFPWDEEQKQAKTVVSDAEIKERYKAAIKRWGLR